MKFRNTITSTHTILLPDWYIESSGTWIASTSAQITRTSPASHTRPKPKKNPRTDPSLSRDFETGPDVRFLLPLTGNAPMARSMTAVVSQERTADRLESEPEVPSERQRVLRAAILGVTLGLVLALLARGRRTGKT
jgi:hypothetical protein